MTELSLLTIFDYIIITIIGLSLFFGFIKGFINSFLTFFGWLLSAYLAIELYPHTTNFLQSHISNKIVLTTLSSLGAYLALLIATSFVNNRIMAITSPLRGGLIDMSFGMAFGVLRGCIVACIIFWCLIVILTAWDENSEPEWLKKSQSYNLLNSGTTYIISNITSTENDNELINFLGKWKRFKNENADKLLEDEISKFTDKLDSSNIGKSNEIKELTNDLDSKINNELENNENN